MINKTATFRFSRLPRAGRSALQWRLLLLWTGCLLIPAIVAVLPMWQMLGANLDHSVHAARLAQELDMLAITDLLGAHGKNAAAFANAGLFALALTLLLSPLLSGMVVTAARAAGPPGLRDLAAGGLREYPRMFRMLLWAAVPLGIAAALGGAAMNAAEKHAQTAILESSADNARLAAMALFALLFMLAHATIDAGRAALAIERRRTSAVKAWWDGLKMLLKRPVATFGTYACISLAGFAIAALLTLARLNVPYIGTVGFIGGIVLTLAIVAVTGWMRSARLFAMVDLAQSIRPS